jgi:hypothetical protein
MIIGLHGAAGSGKDTAAEMLMADGYAWYSFAMPIKAALNAMFGWDMSMWEDRVWKETVIPQLGKSPRYLAQTLGTEWGRELINPDLWTILGQEAVVQCIANGTSLVISDVRFENEAEMIRCHGGSIVHIYRDGVEEVEDHASEAGIRFHPADVFLDNSGTMEELVLEMEQIPYRCATLADIYYLRDTVDAVGMTA